MSNSDKPQASGPSTANRTNATGGSSRWWQFYLVRYATGTAVGAVVFYFLCAHSIALEGLLFKTDATMRLDWPHLTLLAAYGLAYCYIASSPFLVFHVGRFLLKSRNDVESLKSFACWSFVILILVVPALFILVWLALFSYRHNGLVVLGELLSRWAAYFLAVWTWLLQWKVVKRTIKEACLTNKEENAVYRFYEDLAKRRGTEKVKNGEIVDSYRHLREHGNALSIVLLEIVLGAALIRMDRVVSDAPEGTKLSFLALVVAVWVLPGALVWLIGSYLELSFSKDPDWLS